MPSASARFSCIGGALLEQSNRRFSAAFCPLPDRHRSGLLLPEASENVETRLAPDPVYQLRIMKRYGFDVVVLWDSTSVSISSASAF